MSLFFLQTAMLWTAVVAAAIVILHVILPRWRRRPVPSLLIWRKVRERGFGVSARRLSMDIVLLLAAFAAILLVAASSDPRLVAEHTSGGQLVVVVDNGTASLTEGAHGATRLADAVAEAQRALGRLASGETAAVVATSPAPRLVGPLGTVRAARAALSSLRSAHRSGDVTAATALALATGSSSARILVISSRLPDDLPQRARGVRVGRESRNLAVVRADFGADRAFCGLRNFGARDVGTVVSLRIMSPEPSREVARQAVTVPAGGRSDVVLGFDGAELEGARVMKLSHLFAEDDLHVDDAAFAARLSGGARRVTIVGDASEPLARALWAAGAEVTHAPSGAVDAPATAPHLIVFAGVAPRTWPPEVPCILVRPPRGVDGLELTGDEVRDVEARFAGADSPRSLVAGFAPGETISVARASRARFFANHTPLVTAGREVLAAEFDAGGIRHIYLGFALEDSDWTKRASFPVFVTRALAKARTRDSREGAFGYAVVGDTPVSLLPVDAMTLTAPGGEEVSRAVVLPSAGLYAIRSPGRDEDAHVLAVNLVSERESDNRLASESATDKGDGLSPAVTRPRVEARALAPLLAFLALALCAGEWYLSSRRD